MMTWLPHPSFAHSAAALSEEHLRLQRTECMQILACLRGGHGLPQHMLDEPVVQMWRDHESALAVYMTLCCVEWERRGERWNPMTPYNTETWLRHPGFPGDLALNARGVPAPPWLGDRRLHESHQRALLQRDPEHYRQSGWRVTPRTDLWWPEAVGERTDAA